MTTIASGLALRRGSYGFPLLALGLSVFVAAGAAFKPSLIGLGTIAAIGLVLIALAPITTLPAAALVLFAFLPAPYLPVPKLVGAFFSPAVLVLLGWVARALFGKERRVASSSWLWISAIAATLLLAESLRSLHPSRSVTWSAVFLITAPLTAVAAVRVPGAGRALERAWVFVAIGTGLVALLESATHWNPLAHHYLIAGASLGQRWSVYRIETTLGHPLMNATFFATTATVMVVRAIRQPRILNLLAAGLSISGVVFAASRAGALALVLGAAAATLCLVFHRTTSVGFRVLALTFLAAAVVAVWQSPALRNRDQSAEGRASFVYRSVVLQEARSIMRADHYLGSGPGTSARRVALNGSDTVIENSVLQIGISCGIAGLLLVVCLLGTAIVGSARRQRWEAVGGIVAVAVVVSGWNVWDQIPSAFSLLSMLFIIGLSPPSPELDRA